MSIKAKSLAIAAGLILDEEAVADRIEDANRYNNEWFETEGIFTDHGRHPLDGDPIADKAKDHDRLKAYTQRRQKAFREAMGAAAWRRDFSQTRRHPELAAPGYYRWQIGDSAYSSMEMASQQLKTPRQIAGFMGGKYPGMAISVIHTANARCNGRKTPIYTAFISQRESGAFLFKENSYATALKEVDITEIDALSRRITKAKRVCDKAYHHSIILADTLLDEAPGKRWRKKAKRLSRLIEELTTQYSAMIAHTHQYADTAEEPLVLLPSRVNLTARGDISHEYEETNEDRDVQDETVDLVCTDEDDEGTPCGSLVVVDRVKALEGHIYHCPDCGAEVSINQEDLLIEQELDKSTKTGYRRANRPEAL